MDKILKSNGILTILVITLVCAVATSGFLFNENRNLKTEIKALKHTSSTLVGEIDNLKYKLKDIDSIHSRLSSNFSNINTRKDEIDVAVELFEEGSDDLDRTLYLVKDSLGGLNQEINDLKDSVNDLKTLQNKTKPAPKPVKKEIEVYITRTGSKYHSYGCRYLSRSCIPVNLSDAVNQGYGPCSVCGPPIP